MFRLLKLAAYGLLGYAIYEFVRGVLHGVERAEAAAGNALRGQSQSGGGGGGGAGGGSEGARMNMTGPGEGVPVATQEADGGSISHRVGRGVVSR